MTTQRTGKITTWKNDKGFGFITPDQGGQQVFFHISELSNNHARPAEQMKVTYTLSYDHHQRPRAIDVRLTEIRTALPTLPLLVISVFFLVLTLTTYVLQIPICVLVGYVLISSITFYVYGVDKASAMQGAQRVPEVSLHLLEFLGGWPGALVAQSFYHHKTRKASFQSTYWGMVIANLLALVLYSFIQHVR